MEETYSQFTLFALIILCNSQPVKSYHFFSCLLLFRRGLPWYLQPSKVFAPGVLGGIDTGAAHLIVAFLVCVADGLVSD